MRHISRLKEIETKFLWNTEKFNQKGHNGMDYNSIPFRA
jgi:hypothetical protein